MRPFGEEGLKSLHGQSEPNTVGDCSAKRVGCAVPVARLSLHAGCTGLEPEGSVDVPIQGPAEAG